MPAKPVPNSTFWNENKRINQKYFNTEYNSEWLKVANVKYFPYRVHDLYTRMEDNSHAHTNIDKNRLGGRVQIEFSVVNCRQTKYKKYCVHTIPFETPYRYTATVYMWSNEKKRI